MTRNRLKIIKKRKGFNIITSINPDKLTQYGNKIHALANESVWYILMMCMAFLYSLLKLLKLTGTPNPNNIENWPYLDYFNIFYAADILINLTNQCLHKKFTKTITYRPLWVIIFEIISIIPFSVIINSFTELSYISNSFVECLQALKLVRLCYNIYFNESHIHVSLWIRLLTILSVVFMILFVGFSVSYNIGHLMIRKKNENIGRYRAMRTYIGIITTFGFPTMTNFTNIFFLSTIVIFSALSGFFVNGVLTASTTYDNILASAHKIYFRNRINMFKHQSSMLVGFKSHVLKLIYQFFNKLWVYQRGHTFSHNLFRILPYAMQTEILLDTFCVALKHSTLFRKCDISFARFLSSMMTQRYYGPNEYVYEIGEVKDKMIYVVSGIIQIVSAQDNQTPIISLSAGTCLGEMSLIEYQVCIAYVRCENYVELQILHRKDFLKCIRLYPDKFRLLLKEARERCDKAKRFHEMLANFKIKRNTIVWLKDIMGTILSNEKKHECDNIYIESELEMNEKENIIFTPDYLDSLVLSDKYELEDDAEFIWTRFPFILHPNAFVLKLWETYVTLLCIILLFVLPTYIFSANIPLWLQNFCILVSYSWFMDLFLLACTAVIHKDEFHSTFKAILKYRLKTSSYFMDIFATIPFEMFTVISIADEYGFNKLIMRLNRLVKCWRIFKLFHMWENKLHVDFTKLVYARFTFILIYLVYIISCLLFASNCSFEPYDCRYSENYSTVFSAIQIVTGIGLCGTHDQEYHENNVYFVSILMSYICFILMSVYCISAGLLRSTQRITLEKMTIELSNILKMHQIQEQFSKRVDDYIDTQWHYNNGISLLSIENVEIDIPRFLFKHLCEASFVDLLRDTPFFKNIPDAIMCDICSVINYNILPYNEVICYAGDFANNLLILGKGMCDILGQEKAVVQKPTVLNPFAFIYQVPIVRTCITKTYCFILTLAYADFVNVLRKHPGIDCWFGLIKEYRHYYQGMIEPYILLDTSLHKVVMEKPWSVYNIGYKLEPDSQAEHDYHAPFYKLGKFSFTKYLLMRTTINPNGKLFLIYEILRSCFVIVTVLLHATYYIVASQETYWLIIFIVLDALAFFDLYFRMHICYFNDDNVLVKHPLFTAKNYLTHGFLLDLFACLPLNIITPTNHTDNNTGYLCLHSNRFLQMHRYWHITQYLGNRHLHPKSRWYYLTLIPFVIFISLFAGSIILARNCLIEPTIKHDANVKKLLDDGISCDIQCWLIQSDFKKPISPLRAQLYSFYLVTSCFTTIGMQGFTLQENKIGFITAILSVIGFYFSIHILDKFVTYLSATSDVLSMYQSSLTNLKNCLKYRNVSYKLQQLIVNHYDLRWNRQRGKDVVHLMQNFHYTLQQDILYHIYGRIIYENSIFPPEGMKLIRNLLLYTTHETFMKGANIIRVNDVNSFVHIIYRGTVDVVASDGTILDSLEIAGIFGNLDGHPYIRQKMNFVAQTIVELLSIESVQFYRVINDYHTLKKIFLLTTERFVHYLPSKQNRKRKQTTMFTIESDYVYREYGLGTKAIHELRTAVFDRNSGFMSMWQTLNLIASYMSILLFLYQCGFSEFHLYYICIQYFFDGICIINFYIKDHLAYEDERGQLVTNLFDIKKHNRKNKLQYWSNIIGIVPADILAYILPTNVRTKHILLKVLRMNRLQRIRAVIEYFEFYREKITTKINLLQLSFMAFELFLLIMFTICVTIWLCTFFEDNMSKPVPTDIFNVPTIKKIKLLFTYMFGVLSTISRIAQGSVFPNAPTLIAMCAIEMIVYIFAWALVYAQISVITFKAKFLKTSCARKFYKIIDFLEKQEISECIVRRVKRYVDVVWMKYEGIIHPYLLRQAPFYIYEAIVCERYMIYINANPIFKKCHMDFKRQVACKLKTQIYLPGDYVTFKESKNNTMYFIHRGYLEVLDEDTFGMETTVKFLLKYNWFGIMQGFDALAGQEYSYKSMDYTVILSLHFNDWKYLLEFFPASHTTILKELNVIKE